MNEKMLKAMTENGVVKKATIIANGATIYIEITTATGVVTASTNKGAVKTWATLDAAARWMKTIGIAKAQLNVAQWAPKQRRLELS